MSSDNQYTALGPAAIGFQCSSTTVTSGALLVGTQSGAVIQGQTTPTTAPVFGAQVVSLFPAVDIPLTHVPIYTGLLAFGEPWGIVGMSGAEIRQIGGFVDGANIPFSVDYGVVGVGLLGPGVLGVGDRSGQAPPNLQVGSTGVMGVSQLAPGVTGVSVNGAGVQGASDNVGMIAISPNSTTTEDIALNIKNVGSLGVSENVGVVGISSKNTGLVAQVNSTHGVGVLGASDGIGVMGLSAHDRGGVFLSTAQQNHKLTAQVRLVPLTEGSPKGFLPRDGKTGDLIAVQNASGVCGLYFCTDGQSPTNLTAKWGQVNLTPIP